jgi:beta-lactamase superfamily II metal-dependent hydrolase
MSHFGTCSPWGWLGSLLLAPGVALTIVLSFAVTLLAGVPAAAGHVGRALEACAGGLLWLVDRVGSMPGALLETPTPPGWLVAGSYAALVLATWVWSRAPDGRNADETTRASRRNSGRTMMLLAAATTLGWLTWFVVLRAPAPPPNPCLAVFDVGDGRAAALLAPDGSGWALDCGTRGNFDAGATVADALAVLGCRRLEGVLLTGLDAGRFSGLPTLIERWDPGGWSLLADPNTIEPRRWASLVEALPADRREPRIVRLGEAQAAAGGTVSVLAGPDVDSGSLVLWDAGAARVLFAGAADARGVWSTLDRARREALDLRAEVVVVSAGAGRSVSATRALAAACGAGLVVVQGGVRSVEAAGAVEASGAPVAVVWTRVAGAAIVDLTPAGPRVRGEAPDGS